MASSTAGADPGLDLDLEFALIPTETFMMGDDRPEPHPGDGEGPARRVTVGSMEMSVTTVTNADFGRFVQATGYRTTAEVEGTGFVFAGFLPDDFPPTQGVAAAPWWRLVEGADWRHPHGPQSDLTDRLDHPVVQISWFDAVAFGQWSNTRLPTEAEWECAARGGVTGAIYPWGDDPVPDGVHRANVWQGVFPTENTMEDGWYGTAPVLTYEPNGRGLYQMVGNVWEWCSDWFDPVFHRDEQRVNPTGPNAGTHKVMRGGSYLCHDSYCHRNRVAARSSNMPDASTGNLGFRVVRRPT